MFIGQKKFHTVFSHLDDEISTEPYYPEKVGKKSWGTLAEGINKSTIKITAIRN